MKVNPVDHCSHNYPYKKGFVEEIVKTVAAAPTAEITERVKKVHEQYGFFPYGFYPYGALAPVSQWQNDGKLNLLFPLEVAKMSNPGQNYISIKDLRARQK
jgi:hypothetical protein